MVNDAVIQVVMGSVLLFVMFSMGLVLTWQDFRRVAQMPRTVALGLAAQIILLPLLAIFAIHALGLPTAAAIGVLLVAICPSGPTSNFFSYIAGGDLALSLTLNAMVTLLSLVTLPLLFSWTFLRAHAVGVDIPALYIVKALLLSIVVPTLAGMLIRARRPAFAGRTVKYTEKIGPMLIMLVVALMFIKNRAVLGETGGLLLASAAVVNVGGMLVGYFWAALFRLGADVKKTFSFEVGLQNIPLATTLAYGLFSADERRLAVILTVIVLYGVMSLISALGGFFIFKKLPGRAGTDPAADEA